MRYLLLLFISFFCCLANAKDILSTEDVSLHKKIFATQQKGDFKTADTLINQLDNDLLLGYILSDRYLSPTYRTSKKEITDWFNEYEDLPVALPVYQLGLKKKASLPDEKPKSIFGSGTCAAVFRQEPIDLIRNKSFSYLGKTNRKKAQRQMQQIVRYLQSGKTLLAKKLIQSNKKLFSTADTDAALTALAFSYFLDGYDTKAKETITPVITRNGKKIPLAFWVGGLTAWRQKNFEKAAEYFEKITKNENAYSLLKAAAGFWAARAYLKTGKYEKVGEFFEYSAVFSKTFYGFLALRALGTDVNHGWDVPDKNITKIPDDYSNPALDRFHALKQVGRENDAKKELYKLYIQADADTQSILSVIAEDNGLTDELYLTSGKLSGDSTRYPAPNWPPKGGWQLNKALVFAFVRQESCFNNKAQSAVGAVGLMQIMPKTGRELAKNLGYSFSTEMLKNPEYNLALGQRYLQNLLNTSFINNNLLFTAVAYNAGPGNLQKWLKKMRFSDDPLLFIESIPSKETRAFVERIMVNYWIYKTLMNQSLKSLDDTISGNWPLYKDGE